MQQTFWPYSLALICSTGHGESLLLPHKIPNDHPVGQFLCWTASDKRKHDMMAIADCLRCFKIIIKEQ